MAVRSKPVKSASAVSVGTTASDVGPGVPRCAVDGRTAGKESRPT
ncbi:hypothetical protein ACFUJ0_25330 [Streptomyces sp. NPDC057242]